MFKIDLNVVDKFFSGSDGNNYIITKSGDIWISSNRKAYTSLQLNINTPKPETEYTDLSGYELARRMIKEEKEYREMGF